MRGYEMLLKRSEVVAASDYLNACDSGRDSMYAAWLELRRHRDGRYWTRVAYVVGGELARRPHVQWLADADAAAEWIATYAVCPISGYGYTVAQAADILAGRDPGKGVGGDAAHPPEWLDSGRDVAADAGFA